MFSFIKSYTYTVLKVQLLNAIDSVILKTENIVYAGKSKIGKDLILYEAVLNVVP